MSYTTLLDMSDESYSFDTNWQTVVKSFFSPLIMEKHRFHVSGWRTAAYAATCNKTEAWCAYFKNVHQMAALSWLTLLRGLQCGFNWHCSLCWQNVDSFERNPSRKGTRGAEMERSGTCIPPLHTTCQMISVSVSTSPHKNLVRCNSVTCLNLEEWIQLQFITVTYQHLWRRFEVNYIFCSLCWVL